MKTAEEFKLRLEELGACGDARKWASGKTTSEAWNECNRGDWLLWWAAKENAAIRDLILAKARCAKLVVHLMTDERSVKAVEAAEMFGLGEIDKKELNVAAYAASAAAYAAYAASAAVYGARAASTAAYTAAYAASAAVYGANAASTAAYVAASAASNAAVYGARAASAAAYTAAYAASNAASTAAYVAASAAAYAARVETFKKCAEIVRETITPNFL